MLIRRFLLRALALCCLLASAGCWESPLPEGVVATVNGEAIHIRTVQAYMDGNSPGLGAGNTAPDIRRLRRDYGAALSDIIIQTLAVQDLQRRGIHGVEQRARDMEDDIREDYGPGEFDAYLAEESLDPAEWRRLLRGFVALQLLEDVVLEPELRVSRDEGHTWSKGLVLVEGTAGYSALALQPDGALMCLYETWEDEDMLRQELLTITPDEFEKL